MPRTVPCPVCHTDVKVPRDAEPGDELTCPECDEVFTPKHLRKKGYDPKDEGAYRFEGSAAPERTPRPSIDHIPRSSGARKKPRVSWFSGPEIWLVIFAVGAAGGLPFGLWLARNWERLGTARVFWLFCGLLLLMALCASLGAGAWSWLRKNR